MLCFKCGKENPVVGLVGRGDNCFSCLASLRACKNCRHYDLQSYNECIEPSSDRVVDKESSNFCDYFTPGSGGAGGPKSALDPKAAAEALFKKR